MSKRIAGNDNALCRICGGVRWVCENHPDRPWSRDLPHGCACGAGMPCPNCNPADAEHPPRLPAGFRTDIDKDRWRH